MLAVIIIAFVDIFVTLFTFPLVCTATHRVTIIHCRRSTVGAPKTAVPTVFSAVTGGTVAYVRSFSASLFDPACAAVQAGRADAVVLALTNITYFRTFVSNFFLKTSQTCD